MAARMTRSTRSAKWRLVLAATRPGGRSAQTIWTSSSLIADPDNEQEAAANLPRGCATRCRPRAGTMLMNRIIGLCRARGIERSAADVA